MFSIFHWLRDRRRKKILAAPFPDAWNGYIKKNLPYFASLTPDEIQRLWDLIQIFVAEKDWLGCNGLVLTEEIKVTIASEASLLVLELPHDYYRNVESIYVYPSTILSPEPKLGVFEVSTVPLRGPLPILGEAHLSGPVLLVWDAVENEARHPERGHNVVFHEFAHKLDMLNGRANGTPPLANREEYQRWRDICSEEYLKLRDQLKHGHAGFFDAYAATNEAEFFAVVTEYFFTKPEQMLTHHPALYGILKSFYRQDPAHRGQKTECIKNCQ